LGGLPNEVALSEKEYDALLFEEERINVASFLVGSDFESDEDAPQKLVPAQATCDIHSMASPPPPRLTRAAAAAAAAAAISSGAGKCLDSSFSPAGRNHFRPHFSDHFAGSPPLEAFGAVLPNLDPEAPIAQRTRTHINLEEVSMDNLGAILDTSQFDEPLLHFEVDDAQEYERFLACIQGGGPLTGTATDTEAEKEDSDDEDFMKELERMLEDEAGDLDWTGDGALKALALNGEVRRAESYPNSL